ncbi:MAG TPA: hypothetical protein VN700_01880 [Vicinamibacterales bacterium]|nr:hypothetical protein [Vicinamibacterales bacterium]
MIAPPVGGDSFFARQHQVRLTAYVLSLVAASLAVGSLFGLTGAGIRTLIGDRLLLLGCASICAVAIHSELRRPRGYCGLPISSHWQVPRHWAGLGSPRFEILFGAILGTGFITVVPYSCVYCLMAWLVASADPILGAIGMGAFGVARAIPMVVVSARLPQAESARGNAAVIGATSAMVAQFDGRLLRVARWAGTAAVGITLAGLVFAR